MLLILRKLLSIKTIIIKKIRAVEVENSATLEGKNHNFDTTGKVILQFGSEKSDVVLKDHAELFGTIYSTNHAKIVIGEWVKRGAHGMINSANSIIIGKDTAIADSVIIIDNNTHPVNPEDRKYMNHTPHDSCERNSMCSDNAPIVIGENVWIGRGVRVHKGVTIGDNSIIGANSVVTKSIPANCIAVGNPTRIVKIDIDKTTKPIFPLKK